MAVPPDVLQSKPQDEAGNTWKYPLTAMVHMARDKHTARGVAEMLKVLADQVCYITIHSCVLCSKLSASTRPHTKACTLASSPECVRCLVPMGTA